MNIKSIVIVMGSMSIVLLLEIIVMVAKHLVSSLHKKKEKMREQPFPSEQAAQQLLSKALMGYILGELPPEEQNVSSLFLMLNAMKKEESVIDALFENLEDEEPEHYAVQKYKEYKELAADIEQSIPELCINSLWEENFKNFKL